MNVLFESLTVYLLVFTRMSGMILVNPLFARRNVPNGVRMILVLCLSILIAPTVNSTPIQGFTDIDFVLAVVLELLVGFVVGFVFQAFYYMLLLAGDYIDFVSGITMAKVFDPSSSIQMSVSGTFLTIFFMLYIFATDSHLELIRIFASSYRIVPLGAMRFNPEIGRFFIELISGLFVLALKVALPFIAAGITVEAAMGILMKIIPQITVFVINIQFKLLVGFGLLFLFAVPISSFIDNYIGIMFESMRNALAAAYT